MTFKILSLTILFFCGAFCEERWHYSWKCVADNCQKSELTELPKNIQYDTLEICRLTCGQNGALWPLPTISTSLSKNVLPFHPSSIKYIYPTAKEGALEFLKQVEHIFHTNLLKECGENCIENTNTNIEVYAATTNDNNEAYLLPDIDESYTIKMRKTDKNIRIRISAPNVFGLRHGFETLSQLTAQYSVPETNDVPAQNGLVILTDAEIQDRPLYKYRGVLLDSSRNWLSVDSIKKQIDGMAASKLNVLHWHVTDSQSFPLDLPSVPNMVKYGAYSLKETYSTSDITNIREYAKLRGVRLLMEVDAPSHAGFGWQWGEEAGLGMLSACVNRQPWRQYCIQPPCGQLNPANQNIYEVLRKVYGDLKSLVVDKEWFHMGGDEVFFPCWNATEEIISYMESKGLGRTLQDFLELWGEFQSKALEAFDKVSVDKVPIILWSSHLTDPTVIEKYLPIDRYIIETWVPASDPLPQQLLEKGYKLIISTKDSWYLDHGFNGKTQYHTWRVAYNNKLIKHENVLGGEVCIWGENVDDEQIDSKLWPRAAAAAERLWSDPKGNDGDAETRLYRHRERLVTRGLKAEALAPKWCYQNERECS